MKKNLKWAICILLIILFILVAYLTLTGHMDKFDQNIYNFITSGMNDITTKVLKFITTAGGLIFIVILSIIIFLINKKYGKLVFINVFNIGVLNIILKSIFMRERPFDLMIIDETGYSFPSGHAMLSMGFYGFLIYLLWQSRFSKRKKIIITILLSFLILTIGISRIYLGVHYPSDILAGFLISLAYLIIFITLVKKMKIK